MGQAAMALGFLAQAATQARSGVVARKQANYQEKAGRRFANIERHEGRQRARLALARMQAFRIAGGTAALQTPADLQSQRFIEKDAANRAYEIRFQAAQQARALRNQATQSFISAAMPFGQGVAAGGQQFFTAPTGKAPTGPLSGTTWGDSGGATFAAPGSAVAMGEGVHGVPWVSAGSTMIGP